MNHPDIEYLKLVVHVLKNGQSKKSRGIHGIRSVFGYQMRFDLRKGFPLLTTKKMPFKILTHELLWFISGDTNIKYLQENKIHYWDGFADKNGDLGPVYGYQWRKFPDGKGGYIDQLENVISEIKSMPDSKYMMVTAINPAMKDEMRLPPCHAVFQFNVTNGKLRCQLYQRSSDVFLGLPFNIAQYALLTHMVAQVTNTVARELVISIGDAHIYNNHKEVAKEQLYRKPFDLPTLKLNPEITNIDSFTIKDIILENYNSHPSIKTDLVII